MKVAELPVDANYQRRVNGQAYTKFLKNFHTVMAPRTYLEIGTDAGGTLMLADCASIAVDPKFRISVDALKGKPTCFFFQETSDNFFRNRSPSVLFEAPVDFAFLDGMHLFEFLLRDFINTERHTHKKSVIMMHDCVPPGFYMTTRDQTDPICLNHSLFREWWTGDVFRIVPVLQRYRPTLTLTILDCAPTGIVMVTGLDAQSDVLERAYDEILGSTSQDLDREEYEAYWRDLHVAKSEEFMAREQLAQIITP